MTKVGVCAIDKSTTLESNKSLLLSCSRAARSHLHVSWCPRGHDNSNANVRQNRQSPATRSTWARSLRPAPSRNGSGALGAPMAPSTHPGNRSPELRGGQRGKPRQHLCYVYASLSRLDFRCLPEKLIVVFEGVIGFSTTKKPTALMMHWWNGGRGGV